MWGLIIAIALLGAITLTALILWVISKYGNGGDL